MASRVKMNWQSEEIKHLCQSLGDYFRSPGSYQFIVCNGFLGQNGTEYAFLIDYKNKTALIKKHCSTIAMQFDSYEEALAYYAQSRNSD